MNPVTLVKLPVRPAAEAGLTLTVEAADPSMRPAPRIPPLISLALICGLLPLAGMAQPPKTAVFPPVTAYSLDKQKVNLPGGMEGQTDLLLISFETEQQKNIDSWMPAAEALQHSNFQFRYYQLPIFPRENFIFRWWDTSSLRTDETDPQMMHWIVPLFVDRQRFIKELDVPNEKEVVALLVNRRGQILWRASGPMTEAKRQSLMAAASQH